MRRRVMEALRQSFRPEFLNRVDETIIFHSLSLAHILKIVDIQVSTLKKRLAERKVDLELTLAAKEYLANEGFDPVYGARPLKRTIQRQVLDPLAMSILEGTFREGDKVIVDIADGRIVFEKDVKVEPGAGIGVPCAGRIEGLRSQTQHSATSVLLPGEGFVRTRFGGQ